MEEFIRAELRGNMKVMELDEKIDGFMSILNDCNQNQIKKGVKRIVHAKQMVDLYFKYKHQFGKHGYYDKFIVECVRLDCEHKEGLFEFLDGQRDNDLPEMSSGSLLTAIKDFDNIISDSEFDEAEYHILHLIYKSIM